MIRDIPVNERPREKAFKYGLQNLSDSELLSIILRTGTYSKDVKDLSLELIGICENISNFKYLTLNRLLEIRGIGKVKAIELLSVIELSKRIYSDKESISIKHISFVFPCFIILFTLLFVDKCLRPTCPRKESMSL